MTGARIRAVRTGAKLTLREVGEGIAPLLGRKKPFLPQTIASWENRRVQSFREHEISALAAFFERPRGYFTAPTAHKDDPPGPDLDPASIRAVPLFEFSALRESAEATGRHWVFEPVPKNVFAFRMPDDSMAPALVQGQSVVVADRDAALADLRPGLDITVVEIGGRAYVRLFRFENGHAVFEPWNRSHERFVFPQEDAAKIKLIGVVVVFTTLIKPLKNKAL